MNKHTFITTSLAFSMSLSSGYAVTLASTDFSGTSKSASNQTMTGISWTEDAVITAGTSVTTVANNNAGYFTSGFGSSGFAPDQNIENEGPWAATFQLTVSSGVTVTLTSIAFDYAGLTNTGTSQNNNFRAQNFDITVNGVVYDIQRQTSLAAGGVNGDLTFTDSVALNTGLNSIEITSSEVNGAGYNMGIDNLSFDGDIVAIPEPSALGLLGLGLLACGRRRRKA